jgi:uncharacterized protein involved in exopolysaccharide biosynthesis
MKNNVSMAEILDIVRRRKMYFLVPFFFITTVSVVGAFLLPKRYESYTTVLIEKNPMEDKILDFTRGFGDENQLGGFNEILTSRTTIRAMLDSIGGTPTENTSEGWDALIDATRRKITIDLRGSESFRISFADSDPFIAQRAATVLCNLYIQTSLKADKQQAEGKVQYLEEAVATLEKEVQEKQKSFLGGEQNRVASSPADIASLELNYNKLDNDARELGLKLQQQERTLKQIEEFQANLDDPGTVARIAALDPEGTINYSDTLKSLSLRYNQLLTRYKPSYPQVQIARRQLADLLRKFGDALEADMQTNKARRDGLVSERERTRGEMSQNVTQNTLKGARTAEYMQVTDNLAETRRKLVMARQAKELVDRGASRYVILDPAQVPATPTKPKKGLIIGGGSALGLVIGLVTMFMMEYYDPTIRRKQDIEVFNKPIIGYLP